VSSHSRMVAKAGQEFLIAGRFGLVGIAATALHMTVVWVLIVYVDLPVMIANLAAFTCAFAVSFAGNYLWTFSMPGSPRRALVRFLVISLSAFAMNNGLLAALLALGWLDEATAVLAAAAVVPFISFVGSRLWGFNASRRGPPTPRSNTLKLASPDTAVGE
jgi:putative flippase GtrA